jgi:hypothetical protein
VEFRCESGSAFGDERAMWLDLTEPGTDLWWPEQKTEDHHHYYLYGHEPARWPPWRREGVEFREYKDAEGGSSSRTVFVSVQWILKCHCAQSCGEEVTLPDQDWLATARPTNGEGEVLLHRVHRTAAP